MSIQDGGPAFPQPPCPDCGTQHQPEHVPGMTLRDYFAAKALQSFTGDTRAVLLAGRDNRRHGHNYGSTVATEASLYAEAAYAIADAMLAERKQ